MRLPRLGDADGCGGYGCNDRTSCFDRACNRCCPAAQATAEPQQTAPTGATDESNDAAPAEQNTPSDNAATPANDAIMPCGVTDVVGGSGVRVNITVRNNYTDIKKEETIEYVKGIALVDGDQSALDGSALTFIGLGT